MGVIPSQNRLDQIRDLRVQWEQLVGYTIEVPDWAVEEMAGDVGRYSTLYDFGQYMLAHVGKGGAYFVPEWYTTMPWAQYGMNATQYDSKLASFDAAFRTLTGQTAPQDLVDQALHEHMGAMTGQQFETWLLSQDAIKKQYGWLRYGLDYNQFQTQKLQMRTQFGRDLSDAEAVAQLQYHHAAQGPSMAAGAQPTLSQAERKQVQLGVTGNVVR